MTRRVHFFFLSIFAISSHAQNFTDIFNLSSSYLPTTYKSNTADLNTTRNTIANLVIPIKIDSANLIYSRLYGEQLSSTIENNQQSTTSDLYSVFLALGLQHETKNKKWKFCGLIIPKLSSDFKNRISGHDEQLGAYALLTYTVNSNLKFKAGLYYNSEFFGNFFVPLLGMDWNVSDRFRLYGTLPTNYRIEYSLVKRKVATGLGFKSFTRSYRLNSALNYDYVRNDEVLLKLFVDFYLTSKIVCFGEFGRTLGYSPLTYLNNTQTPSTAEPVYTPVNDNFFFDLGLAYRVRNY